ncbi:hypothetical protein C8Q75DRAFT_742363 [Abortiporus biennis]|nr:hypothetical protein C8Q75DRAFT_742363 [Abortiporus biennis]
MHCSCRLLRNGYRQKFSNASTVLSYPSPPTELCTPVFSVLDDFMYRKALTTQRISQLGAIYLISFLLHQFASKMSLLSMLGNYPVISTFTLITLIYYVDKKLRYYLTLPLPPGPKRLPLVGNLFNAPTGNEVYKIYQGWTTQYGSDVLYMKLPNTPIVILNSAKACIDLLEKRSHIYSDRPYSVMDELYVLQALFSFGSSSSFLFTHFCQIRNGLHVCVDGI